MESQGTTCCRKQEFDNHILPNDVVIIIVVLRIIIIVVIRINIIGIVVNIFNMILTIS